MHITDDKFQNTFYCWSNVEVEKTTASMSVPHVLNHIATVERQTIIAVTEMEKQRIHFADVANHALAVL